MFLSHLTSYHNLMILYEKQSQQHFYHNNVSFSSLLANSFRVPSTIQVRTRCKPGGIGDGRQRHSARSTVPQPRTGKLETRKTSPSHKEDIQKSWEHFEPRKATYAFATVPRALQTSDGRFLEESGIIYPWLLQNMLCKLFFVHFIFHIFHNFSSIEGLHCLPFDGQL
jgi:hypothetical protein